MRPYFPHRARIAFVALAALCVGFGSCAPKFSPIDVCLPLGNGGFRVIEVQNAQQLRELQELGASVYGRGIDGNCEGGLQVSFESDLTVAEPTIPGFDGGPPRVVGAAVGRDGSQDEFVENEIQIRITSPADLDSFLSLYGGVVLRDDTVIGMADDGSMFAVPGGGDGWHLLRINPATLPLDRAIEAFWNGGFRGKVSFSSEAMASTLAIAVRETTRELGPNQVLEKQTLDEHPRSSGLSFFDFADNYNMTEDDDASEPGDQGLSIGVARAFDYLRHTGLPPIRFGGSWTPARVAVIDRGFDLDPATGLGNPDYVGPLGTPGVAPLQVDVTDGDIRAGQTTDTTDKPWHGQGAFGVCCAMPRNRFGGAGTGGEYVRPILIRMGGSVWEMASAIRSASFMQAAIVTMSWSNWCGDWCEALNDSDLQSAIYNVTAFGGAVFSSAGNDEEDLTGKELKPCTLDQVICVGGMDGTAMNTLNFGAPVDIWGPTPNWSTVAPVFADEDPDDWGLDELYNFGGTSSSTPFVAGIAALAKAANPDLRQNEIQDLLVSTGNTSTDPVVRTGYPDALRLVQAVRPNPPPQVTFAAPTDGDRDSWFRFDSFAVALDDLPAPEGFVGRLVIESDLDGVICDVLTDAQTELCRFRSIGRPTLGTHTISATATDAFGASSTTSISFTLTNAPPSVRIATPSNGDTFLAGQFVQLEAAAADSDGEPLDFTWTSSLDGVLVDDYGFPSFLAASLGVGTHVIEVVVADSYGATASDTIQIEVTAGNGTPAAQITSPPDDYTYGSATVLFRGSGFDPEDGQLPGASLSWFSDQMGFLGTGTSLWVELVPNGCGSQHVITLQATDSDGNTSTDTITIFRGVC